MEANLNERVQSKHFMISFNNLNFYRSKRDQTSMNRPHIENLTASFVKFMESRPHLTADSVDRTSFNRLTCKNLFLGPDTVRCYQESARASACFVLKKYLSVDFAVQKVKDSKGKWVPKYSAWEPPLKDVRCN